MLNDEVIGLAAFQLSADIVEPFMRKLCVNGIHDRYLLVDDNVRIVGHALRNNVLSLEQVDLVVVHTHISYISCNRHIVAHKIPPRIYLFDLNGFDDDILCRAVG